MPRFRCPECAGEYEDPSRDGTPYFHACPPDRTTGQRPDPRPGEDGAIRTPWDNPRDENVKGGPGDDRSDARRPGADRVRVR